MLTSSGPGSFAIAILSLCSAGGKHYRGLYHLRRHDQLFGVTLKSWVSNASGRTPEGGRGRDTKAVQAQYQGRIQRNARQPSADRVPISKVGEHRTRTVCRSSSTILSRPRSCAVRLVRGADIVIHSTTKYMDSHAVPGRQRDCGRRQKFDWSASGGFPDFTRPDEATTALLHPRLRQHGLYHQRRACSDA